MRLMIQYIGCALIGWLLGTSGLPFIIVITICIPVGLLWQVMCIAVEIKIKEEKQSNDK